jgi:cytoskeletal protein CcmA (bactofilin family)
MLGRAGPLKPVAAPAAEERRPANAMTLLAIMGDSSRVEGKFDIADSIHIECAVGGELKVGKQLVIGEKGVVNAKVQTVDAIIQGVYEGTMVATGNVEITATGRVTANIETDSLVISKGAFFNGNVVKTNGREPKAPVYLVEDKRAGLPR